MTMTKEEAKAMEGAEFIYEFKSGDTMPAYVKKVDPETGRMSCWSFSLRTDRGHFFEPLNMEEEIEGACCVLTSRNIDRMLYYLTEIKETGRHTHFDEGGGFFSGCVFRG